MARLSKYMKCKCTSYEGHQVVKLPLSDLWQSVDDVKYTKAKFYSGVLESMQANGMDNPIIVVKTDLKGVWERKNRHKNAMRTPPEQLPDGQESIYVIWGGNNRLAALKELGYKEADCIILDTFEEAYTIQSKQRNSYKELYRKLQQ